MNVQLIKAGIKVSTYLVDGVIVKANMRGEIIEKCAGLKDTPSTAITQALFDFWGVYF